MMTYYPVILALHIIAIISWMAGILYLIRLLVNGRDQEPASAEVHSLLYGMMDRLYRYITFPAMIASYLFGLSMLAISPAWLSQPWFWFKGAAILGLTYSTLHSKTLIGRYERKEPLPTSKQLRFFNEVPTIMMIIIVFMVVLKPSIF